MPAYVIKTPKSKYRLYKTWRQYTEIATASKNNAYALTQS